MNAGGSVDPDRSIAIVGAACRLPGGIDDLDGLWQALVQGCDLVGELPAGRFDVARFVDTDIPRVGESYTAAGGFLADIAGFDAGFFGIAPKEAAQMDPQHRMLLEMAVEALDDAAIAPESLAGSDSAVYVGIADVSYGGLQMMSPASLNAYSMSGAASSVAANRISYCLDLRGPSMSIDTACSSALVALDQACRALLDGTSRTALCGGVNLLLSPHAYIGFSQASMLSRRGRCAAFSANADGFVRAEGGGVVVLKRLDDALADGDRVHAVLVGTGSNSDGKTMGLSLPNSLAQQDLMRSVYRRAGVHPDELVYVEAHGTGTPVGDPVECAAIGAALGVRRTVGALPIGSVKSNLGHLEPASGLVGVLKAVLVLRHRAIPVSLHAEPLNQDIDFTGLGLAPVTELRKIPGSGRAAVGVNSFGFGGANAHVIVAEALPRAVSEDRPTDGIRPLVVSAGSPRALTEAAARLAQRLMERSPFYDIAYTTCLRRGKHQHRRAVLASGPAEAARLLTAGQAQPDSQDEAPRSVAVGAIGEAVSRGEVAFVFSGNGTQWAGMGADLLVQDADFRDALTRVDAALTAYLGWSVTGKLATVTPRELSATEVAQPLLFAVQVGVVTMLRARGITPSVVVGHSVGEVAAAWTAGALSLDQAARVIAERSRAQAATAGSGRMAAVALSCDEACEVLAAYPDIEVVGVNTDLDVTVAGPGEQLEKLADELGRRGVPCTMLDLDYAFHTAAMDPVRDLLCESLTGLAPGGTALTLVSTVSGQPVAGGELDAGYWLRNVREPVLFGAAIEHMIAEGADVFVEIGPHPALRGYLRRIAAAHPQTSIAVVATLRRDTDGHVAIWEAVASLIAAGASIEWDRYFPTPGQVADLPAYPWQREPHWSGSERDWVRTSGDGRIQHPLLGERMPAPHPVWHGAVEPVLVPWLADHRLSGSVVMPATAYVEMALSAGRITLGGEVEVIRLDISRPLVIPWPTTSSVHTQLAVNPDDGAVTITSSQGADTQPRPHARARVRELVGHAPDPVDPAVLRAGLGRYLSADEQYALFAEMGLGYGPEFRVLRELWVGPGEVLASYQHTAPAGEYVIHPALLDGALQAGLSLLECQIQKDVYLPAAMNAVRVWRTPAASGWAHVRERSLTVAEACWDITILDTDGTVTVEVQGCRLRRIPGVHRSPVSGHHTVLRAAPHPAEPSGPSPLPGSRQLVAAAHDQIAELRGEHSGRLCRFSELAKVMWSHGIAEMIAALLSASAEHFSVADLVAAGMLERHTRLVELFLPTLHSHGLVSAVRPGYWRLTAVERDSQQVMRQLLLEVPGSCPEVAMGLLISQHMSALLRGDMDLLELFAAEESERLLQQFYDIGLVSRFQNLVAQALLREMVRHWPSDRPLRVLEVGAGTGRSDGCAAPTRAHPLRLYRHLALLPVPSRTTFQRIRVHGVPHPRPGHRSRCAGVHRGRL